YRAFSADGIKFNGSTATIFLNCINYLLNHTLYGKFQRFPNTNYNVLDCPHGVNFTANERMWVSNVLLKTKDISIHGIVRWVLCDHIYMYNTYVQHSIEE